MTREARTGFSLSRMIKRGHMNKKNRKTPQRIFNKPTRSDVSWSETRSLLLSLDADIKEGRGSRIRVTIGDKVLNLHTPHPQKEMKKYSVELVRAFLELIGARP